MEHDEIIYGIVGIILIIQVIVFIRNLMKINSYNKSILNVEKFKILEFEVPADELKYMEVDEIMESKERYQSVPYIEESSNTEEDDLEYENEDEMEPEENYK